MNDTFPKERPILMSAPMVLSTLEDRKAMTRRGVKFPFPDPQNVRPIGDTLKLDAPAGAETVSLRLSCPYGAVGNRLWVRETFCLIPAPETGWKARAVPTRVFRADGTPWNGGPPPGMKWTPSIFMPRSVSRLTLEITGVRAERLCQISEADALAEGAHDWLMGLGGRAYDNAANAACRWTKRLDPRAGVCSHRGEFAALWEGIHGAGAFGLNPWVWAVSFRRVTADELHDEREAAFQAACATRDSPPDVKHPAGEDRRL